jgi:hypothetical protein
MKASTKPLCGWLDPVRVPGMVKANLRTIWQVGRVRVDDAGPDGNPDTSADNTVFAVQGVFVP